MSLLRERRREHADDEPSAAPTPDAMSRASRRVEEHILAIFAVVEARISDETARAVGKLEDDRTRAKHTAAASLAYLERLSSDLEALVAEMPRRTPAAANHGR